MTQIFDPAIDESTQRTGSLFVVTDSMFSGKSEELIRRRRRTLYATWCPRAFSGTDSLECSEHW